jgi:hypothetical protein
MDGCDEWRMDGRFALRRDQARMSEVETRTRWNMEGDFGDLGWELESSSQRLWISLKDEQEKCSGGVFDVLWTLGDLNHGAHM